MYDDGHIVSRVVWYGPVECLYMYIWWCLYILYASPLALPDFYKHIYAQTRGEKKKALQPGVEPGTQPWQGWILTVILLQMFVEKTWNRV